LGHLMKIKAIEVNEISGAEGSAPSLKNRSLHGKPSARR